MSQDSVRFALGTYRSFDASGGSFSVKEVGNLIDEYDALQAHVDELKTSLLAAEHSRDVTRTERDEAEKENARLVAENDKLAERNGEHAITNARLRKALELIAKPNLSMAESDGLYRQEIAEKALRELNGEKKEHKCTICPECLEQMFLEKTKTQGW